MLQPTCKCTSLLPSIVTHKDCQPTCCSKAWWRCWRLAAPSSACLACSCAAIILSVAAFSSVAAALLRSTTGNILGRCQSSVQSALVVTLPVSDTSGLQGTNCWGPDAATTTPSECYWPFRCPFATQTTANAPQMASPVQASRMHCHQRTGAAGILPCCG